MRRCALCLPPPLFLLLPPAGRRRRRQPLTPGAEAALLTKRRAELLAELAAGEALLKALGTTVVREDPSLSTRGYREREPALAELGAGEALLRALGTTWYVKIPPSLHGAFGRGRSPLTGLA